MRFSKLAMFLTLQGIILLVLAAHLGRWLFSDTTEGAVTLPYSVTMMTVQYSVHGRSYSETYMRNGYEFTARTVPVRYLTYNPAKSRVNSFMGILAEPLAWWLFLSLGLGALLLIDNSVFSKGTRFQVHKRFPWITMDEYFPIKGRWFYNQQRRQGNEGQPASRESLGQ